VKGRLIGVGTGPGDPELLTLKAARALDEAHVVAHFAKLGNRGHARSIIGERLRAEAIELPLYYPMTTEINKNDPDYLETIRQFFDASAGAVAAHLDAGRTVVVLSEGDPFFYGSYMHIHVRLARRYDTEVIPGVTSMSGCWSLIGIPPVQGDDVLTVLPATLAEAELQRRLGDTEAAIILKIGRNLAKVRRALARIGRLNDAFYVERATMADGAFMPLSDKTDDCAPYFAIVFVPGWEKSR
jgi:precorrin-2/cobalt-factor-2 C20-methyltransferase